MQRERLKSILVVILIALIFLVSEITGIVLSRGFKNLLSFVYPSFAFWISLMLLLTIEKKKIVNQNFLIETFILSILFLWAGSFVLAAMHSPITAFMVEDNIPLRYQIYRLPSIALFKTGWVFIMMILIYTILDRGEKKEKVKAEDGNFGDTI